MQDIDDFLEYLCSRAKLVQIYFRWRPMLPDPNDDRILRVAVRTRSTIVTFNTKDFAGAERFDIRVVGSVDPHWRHGMNLTIKVSEELYRRATEMAAAENVSVEELLAALRSTQVAFAPSKSPSPEPRRSALWDAGRTPVGFGTPGGSMSGLNERE